ESCVVLVNSTAVVGGVGATLAVGGLTSTAVVTVLETVMANIVSSRGSAGVVDASSVTSKKPPNVLPPTGTSSVDFLGATGLPSPADAPPLAPLFFVGVEVENFQPLLFGPDDCGGVIELGRQFAARRVADGFDVRDRHRRTGRRVLRFVDHGHDEHD